MSIATATAIDGEFIDPTAAYRQAFTLVVGEQKASTSWLQRHMRIGYNTAAGLMERLENAGVISAANHLGARTVLVAADSLQPDEEDETEEPICQPAQEVATPVEATPKSSGAADQLRLLIERIERLEEERKGIGDDIKDVYLEAKATGYDTKGMKAVIKIRAMSRDARLEQEGIIETYKNALGIE